jgi:small ligand-binding sensory domain FIST
MIRPMIRSGSALAIHADPARAAGEAAREALRSAASETAAAALLFAAGPIDLARALAGVREELGRVPLAGVVGHAVAAGDRERRDGPAAAVLVLCGVEAAAFSIPGDPGACEAIGLTVEALLGRSPLESDLVLVFADPLGVEPRPLAEALGELAPAVVAGAGAALGGSGALLATGERLAPAGACGLVVSLAAPPRLAVSQGCRPITDPLTVTRASGHWVFELAGKPALDVYREAVGGPLAEDLRRAGESVLAAVPRRARRGPPGDAWVACRLAGFSVERRAFALPEPLRVGSALRFALRDADFARDELVRALASLGSAAAGLHLCASDRGRTLFRHPGLESALVARGRAPGAVASLFGSFQVAPLAGSLAALAHASVLVALS